MIDPNLLIDNFFTGDTLQVLRTFPDECVDLCITSPPYNKRSKSQGWLVSNVKYTHFDDHLPEEEYQQLQTQILNELFRVIKPGGSLFYNHKLRWQDGLMLHPITWISHSNWLIKQEIIWDRTLAANMRGWRFWQVDERIYWLYKPIDRKFIGEELLSKHAKMSSIWRIQPSPRNAHHPAPFPIELPSRIIYSLFDVSTNKLVLDPYCGTGTSLVAAKSLGHNFIGIDISPEYIQFAQNRINNFDLERPQILKETEKHKVNNPFAERKRRGKTNWPFGPKPTNDQGSPLFDSSISNYSDSISESE